MKKILLPLLVIFFISCSKQSMNNTTAEPEISFDVDGNHYAYVGQARDHHFVEPGVFAWKELAAGGSPPYFYYEFLAFKDLNNHININVIRDSLEVGTYTANGFYDPASLNLKVNGLLYTTRYLGTTVTISQYNNGIVNGTFTANCYHVGGTSPDITVTNGLLKNIKLRY